MTGYDKRYLRIAMPAALESLFMILLASADLIMVGFYCGGQYFSAAPSCDSLLFPFSFCGGNAFGVP